MNSRHRVWIPENRYSNPITSVEKASINLPSLKFEGHFRLQLINAKTKVIEKELSFPNVITNGALDAIGGSNLAIDSLFSYLAVGTGGVTGGNVPSGSNSSLVAEVTPASSNRTNNAESVGDIMTFVTGSTPYNPYWSIIRHRLFLEAQGNGNLTEIGFFSALTGGTMANRAAIRDNLGNPIVLTKTSDNQLRVDWEWRMYIPVGLVSGTFFIGSGNVDYTSSVVAITDTLAWGCSPGGGTSNGMSDQFGNSFAARFNAYASGTALPTVSGSIPGGSISPTAVWIGPYVNGTYNKSFSSSFDPGVANFTGGVGALSLTNMVVGSNTSHPTFFVVFSPAVPKISTQRFIWEMNLAWYRSVDSE